MQVAPIDQSDRETVERILALDPGPTRRRSRSRSGPRPARRSTRTGTVRPRPTTSTRGALEILDGLEAFSVGEQRGVVVRVTNRRHPCLAAGGCRLADGRDRLTLARRGGQRGRRGGAADAAPGHARARRVADRPAEVLAPPRRGAPHARPRPPARARPLVRVRGRQPRSRRCPRCAWRSSARRRRRRQPRPPSPRWRRRPPARSPASPERTTLLSGYAAGPDSRVRARAGCGTWHAARHRRGPGARRRSPATPRSAARRQAAARGAAGRCVPGRARKADALLVIGDGALRGRRGEREALQQRAALLAARTLGLDTVVLPRQRGALHVGVWPRPSASSEREARDFARAGRGRRPFPDAAC